MPMPQILRGRCPYKDCERSIPFPKGTKKGQAGVCPDCFRLYTVKAVDEAAEKTTLSASR
jgi:hypothetical protein